MNFGEHITRERKRLKLSQANFARAVGVSLSSQKLYELGEREPNVSYLKSLEAIGGDAFFVLNGRYSDEERKYLLGIEDSGVSGIHAHGLALPIVLESLGIDMDTWNSSLGKLLPTIIEEEDGEIGFVDVVHRKIGSVSECFALELIRLSPVLTEKISEAGNLNLSIISDVIERIETVLRDSGKDVLPAKKAQAVVMLYRAFKASGKVDQKMIEEAVKLAAG